MNEPPTRVARSAGQIRVKMLYRGQSEVNNLTWLRQFPGRTPVWGNCRYVFDPDEPDYDWLVVYNDLPAREGNDQATAIEELRCPKQHTLFVTREPSSVTAYGRRFLEQFAFVLTGQEDWAISHPGKIRSQPALRWYYGDTSQEGNLGLRDYDRIASEVPLKKTREVSTVCSAKAQRYTNHNKRLKFVEKACAALPELERFGAGFKPIRDKADAIDPYRYHVVIENHICDHWWTEKLADAFLGCSLPFYCGAPNAADYFPAESFIALDIDDISGSIDVIREAIQRREFDKRLEAILHARRLCLEDYNTFATLSKIVEERHDPSAEPGRGEVIRGKHALRKNGMFALENVVEKTVRRVEAFMRRRS